MDKKTVSFCILFSLVASLLHTNDKQTQNPFIKVIPYLIEGGLIVGGLTTCMIGYFEKKHCTQKRDLLHNIITYCKEQNIHATTLLDEKIFEFAEQLKKKELLLEIIKKNETLPTLEHDIEWNTKLLYVGGGILTAAAIALIITIAIHLYTRDDTADKPQKPKPVTEENSAKQERVKVLEQISQRSEIILQLEKQVTTAEQQSTSFKELWDAIQESLKIYKQPGTHRLEAKRLREIFLAELQKKNTTINKETKQLLYQKLFPKIDSIIQKAAAKNHPFNESVFDESLHKLGRINATLYNHAKELQEQKRQMNAEMNFLHIKLKMLEQQKPQED